MVDFEEAFDSVALSFIKKLHHVCIVTLSPVYQLMDTILNGSKFKNVHDRVIPYRHICFL